MNDVTLTEMLRAREQRAQTQQRLQMQHPGVLLSFTMNIAGPQKNSPLIREGFQLGQRLLNERMSVLKIKPVYQETFDEKTGNEAYYIYQAGAHEIKEITSSIEDDSPLGRLFDMDVLDPQGRKVERTEIGLPARRCLLCDKPARECARSRSHNLSELQEKTEEIIRDAIRQQDAQDAAAYAVRALLYEVATTPKPGLVDRANSGSHRDMDVFTFFCSSAVLQPYFARCTEIGRQTADFPADETFQKIRSAGKKAEADMFAATRGINTHKGAIFSIGILCGALGRLPRKFWNDTDMVMEQGAAMTKGLVETDFAGLTVEKAVTVGQKLYLTHGIRGVRGQMEAGLPAVRTHGLPVLQEGIKKGLCINDAGCATLLSLMSVTEDTCLIARSDVDTWKCIKKEVRELLVVSPYPDRETLEKLDQMFIQRNLSPGGSADLLAICYFLYFLHEEGLSQGGNDVEL